MKTIEELEFRAKSDIEEDLDSIYDVAANVGQQVANVKHMTSFVKLVMRDIASNEDEFSHLLDMI